MNPINTLSAGQLRQAADLKEKIEALQHKLNALFNGAITAPVHAKPAPKGKRKMSAAGLANIRAAQKARWAKAKAVQGKPAKKARRNFSAAAKAKMAVLMKARWAKAKRAGKTKL
jgi:hypothetical protein